VFADATSRAWTRNSTDVCLETRVSFLIKFSGEKVKSLAYLRELSALKVE
jgi:hypothetical protein